MSCCRRTASTSVQHLAGDEVAWRKGHKYLTLAGDHDQGCVMCGTEGKGQAAADELFDALDPLSAKPPAVPGRCSWEREPAIRVPVRPLPDRAGR